MYREDGIVTDTMQLPHAATNYLVGGGGATTQRLQNFTNAEIQVGRESVTVSGSASEVDLAML